MNNFPKTDFAMDSKYKLDLIYDRLAEKEMFIGKHYLKKRKWIPAINRYKTVVEDYNTTIYVEVALQRLVEIHYKIVLILCSKRVLDALPYPNHILGAKTRRYIARNQTDDLVEIGPARCQKI